MLGLRQERCCVVVFFFKREIQDVEQCGAELTLIGKTELVHHGRDALIRTFNQVERCRNEKKLKNCNDLCEGLNYYYFNYTQAK